MKLGFRRVHHQDIQAVAACVFLSVRGGDEPRAAPANPAIEGLIGKGILTEMPDGKFVMRPSALAEYDDYFGKVGQFRAAEMSRMHKNPIMTAIKWGKG